MCVKGSCADLEPIKMMFSGCSAAVLHKRGMWSGVARPHACAKRACIQYACVRTCEGEFTNPAWRRLVLVSVFTCCFSPILSSFTPLPACSTLPSCLVFLVLWAVVMATRSSFGQNASGIDIFCFSSALRGQIGPSTLVGGACARYRFLAWD